MKVLLLGATGNLGSRLVSALLTHSHSVVVLVRNPAKLESLFPGDVYQRLQIIKGDATDASAIKRAIVDNGCDAAVSAAGVAAVAPWSSSNLPKIFRAILDGVREAGADRGSPLRTWFLGGTGVLYYPGTETMLSNYVPIYLEHRQNVHLLRSLPPNSVEWSILCPMTMTFGSSELSVPSTPSPKGKLVTNANTPPNWQQSWIGSIPILGRTFEMAMNAGRYETTLEQNAELIASDLEDGYESRWIGKAVGVIDAAR